MRLNTSRTHVLPRSVTAGKVGPDTLRLSQRRAVCPALARWGMKREVLELITRESL
jgi:hypothetical protein